LRAILFLCTALLAAPAALAQQPYPQKPIRYVVPFPAGGIADIFARIIGARLGERWSQPVIVENRTGAGGNIGADLVAKSAPDGYTLLMGSIGTQAVNASLFRDMPYDSAKDFTAIALVLEAESLLALHPSIAAGTPAELIALARAQPGKLAYGSAGVGTASHLAGELFKSMARVDITHVPLQGQRTRDHRSACRPNPDGVRDHADGAAAREGGQAERHRRARKTACPRRPSSGDGGDSAGFEVNNWIGTFGPAGLALKSRRGSTPRSSPSCAREVQQRLLGEGARFTPMAPEQFAGFVAAETAKWGKLIREVGIRAD
jgi:tripartite-type tricarboxylate transporter receptor subunit TctC